MQLLQTMTVFEPNGSNNEGILKKYIHKKVRKYASEINNIFEKNLKEKPSYQEINKKLKQIQSKIVLSYYIWYKKDEEIRKLNKILNDMINEILKQKPSVKDLILLFNQAILDHVNDFGRALLDHPDLTLNDLNVCWEKLKESPSMYYYNGCIISGIKYKSIEIKLNEILNKNHNDIEKLLIAYDQNLDIQYRMSIFENILENIKNNKFNYDNLREFTLKTLITKNSKYTNDDIDFESI